MAAAALGAGAPADAASRKIAIGDFRWSPPEVAVDLGDTVTWFWVGPDTQHSVTGLSANAAGMDSDAGRTPEHRPGDRFELRFTQPGVYDFHCTLHAIVRGRVTVGPLPGTGAPSADPDPPLNVDAVAPVITEPRLLGRTLRWTQDEQGAVIVDVERRVGRAWRLAGTRRTDGHVGWNRAALPARVRRPGRYRALLVATDAAGNKTADVVVPFRLR